MRTIKFRGKRVDNGEYVYGDYLRPWEGTAKYAQIRVTEDDHKDEHGNIVAFCGRYDVEPNTVAQFVGIDKNGCEVYEGDKIFLSIGTYRRAKFHENFDSSMATLVEDSSCKK